MPIIIPTIKKGEIITAQFLSSMARQLNELSTSISGGTEAIPQAGTVDVQGATPEEVPPTEEVVDEVTQTQPTLVNWTEVERTEETVRVVNPEDSAQFVDVGRLITIKMVNEAGEEEIRTYQSGTG